VDGKPYGQSPADLRLDAGRHELTCSQASVGGPTVTQALDLRPGQELDVSPSLFSTVKVRIELAKAVLVDDRSMAPHAVLDLAPGQHKIGDRWLTIPTHDCTLRDSPELACY
jgi:hypothetical protein